MNIKFVGLDLRAARHSKYPCDWVLQLPSPLELTTSGCSPVRGSAHPSVDLTRVVLISMPKIGWWSNAWRSTIIHRPKICGLSNSVIFCVGLNYKAYLKWFTVESLNGWQLGSVHCGSLITEHRHCCPLVRHFRDKCFRSSHLLPQTKAATNLIVLKMESCDFPAMNFQIVYVVSKHPHVKCRCETSLKHALVERSCQALLQDACGVYMCSQINRSTGSSFIRFIWKPLI